MQIEIAVVRRHFHDLLQLHEFFANTTISDQALDGANAPWCRRRAKFRKALRPAAGQPFLPDRRPPQCDPRAAAPRRPLRATGIRGLVGLSLPAMISGCRWQEWL